jgi:FKBP-type peptidyl-prolyl cis-trans isomerase FkpA
VYVPFYFSDLFINTNPNLRVVLTFRNNTATRKFENLFVAQADFMLAFLPKFVTFGLKSVLIAMKKYIQTVVFFITITVLFFNSSCIDNNEIEPRTFDDELAELDAMITKLEESGFDVDTTDIGVYYIVEEEGEGPFPKDGDTCFIDFRGYFKDGILFHDSEDYHTNGIWKFIFGKPDMIPGLKSGLKQMNEGAKIEMIIPSNLAYGDKGTANIPPFTTLIYESKMHELNPVEE